MEHLNKPEWDNVINILTNQEFNPVPSLTKKYNVTTQTVNRQLRLRSYKRRNEQSDK